MVPERWSVPPRRARPIPLLAAVLGTGSVVTLALALTLGGSDGWVSVPALACLATALVLSAWFVRNEMTSRNALIEPSLRGIGSLRTGAAAAALYMASVGSEFYLLTLLLQTVRHYSPLRAGLAFLPLAVMVTVGSVAAARAARRFRPGAVLTAGFVIALAGLLWIAALLRDGCYPVGLLPGLLLSGFGHGVIYTATFTVGTSGVPGEHQGTAGALLTTAQYLAGAVTLAVLTLVLAQSPGYAGFTAAFLAHRRRGGSGRAAQGVSTILPNTSPAAIFWCASTACSSGSRSCTTDSSSSSARGVEQPGDRGAPGGCGHGVGAEGRERHRLLERREHLHGEVRRRVARDHAHGHHAAVRVEPGEEGGHVRARCDVDNDVVPGRRVLAAGAAAVEHVSRPEAAQAIAARGRRRGDRHRAGAAATRELDGHYPDAARGAAYQYRLARSEAGMAQSEVGYRAGTSERHRVGSGQSGPGKVRRGELAARLATGHPDLGSG